MSDKNKEIYSKLCDLVLDPEFNEGQTAFFVKNCKHFSDDEENKHIYKEIHEEYIKILEMAIDAQIKQSYSEADLDAFYDHFSQNFKEYLEINQDAYEVMKASLDFPHFKEQMLKCMVENQEKPDQTEQNFGSEGANKFFELSKENFDDPNLKWSKILDLKKDGFEAVVHRRPIDGDARGTSMVKMNIIFKKTTVKEALEMFKNGPPIDNLKERKVIKGTEQEKFIYIRMSPGGFVSDRDQVIKKNVDPQPDGSVLLTIQTHDLPEYPEVPGLIRIQMFKAMMLKQEGEDLRIVDFSNMDLKGYFPVRIMNMMMGTIMGKGIPKLRKTINEIQANGGVYNDPLNL